MLKKILFVCFVSFGYFTINAQKISGKVYTQNSLRPIEKVAIATNLKTGAVSNSQGKFILNLKNVKELTFSYLGYETKTIFVDDFKKQNFNYDFDFVFVLIFFCFSLLFFFLVRLYFFYCNLSTKIRSEIIA